MGSEEGHSRGRISSVRIEVFDNQIEPALKALKKQMLAGGIFKEMKLRAHYEKPSVKRKRKQAEARRKRRKALKRAARFEGPDG
jgi:small subunit ribosomal protein S21